MARYIITTAATVGSGATAVRYEKGSTAELTSTQASAITSAGGAVRLANNPVLGTQVTTYASGATSSVGTHAASETHDTLGEAAGVSN